MKYLSSTSLTGLFIALSASSTVYADEVQVAVAANFATPLKALAASFKQKSGHNLQISPEATGKLYAQIKNGAPYEVFLSADQTTPQKLAREGDALATTEMTYGIGKLALWSASPNLVDDKGEVLKSSSAAHLAIANPQTAPYGAAGVSVLKALNVYDKWQPKLVQGENIAQTYQFVGTGNAELGFVALSQIQQDGKITSGSAWIVDNALYSPLKQDAILLKQGEKNAAAKAFLEFLKSAEAKALINKYGYDVE